MAVNLTIQGVMAFHVSVRLHEGDELAMILKVFTVYDEIGKHKKIY